MNPAARLAVTAVFTALACGTGLSAALTALAGLWPFTIGYGLACAACASLAARLFRGRVRELRGPRR